MRGRAITKDEREALMRVVAVLLSMANLAERAAYLPFPVRWLSLWALWRARYAVEGFLSGTGSEVLSRRGSRSVRRGYSAVDALGLAAALRLLAFALRRHTERLARAWLTWKGEATIISPAIDPAAPVAPLPRTMQGFGPARPITCDTS